MWPRLSGFFTDGEKFDAAVAWLYSKLPSLDALKRYALALFMFLTNQGVIPVPGASDTKWGWWGTAIVGLGALLKSSGEKNYTEAEVERMVLEALARQRIESPAAVPGEQIPAPPPSAAGA